MGNAIPMTTNGRALLLQLVSEHYSNVQQLPEVSGALLFCIGLSEGCARSDSEVVVVEASWFCDCSRVEAPDAC